MSRKADIYQKGLTDLAKGSLSGTASMPSEIGQLILPGFFSNLFALKSKGLKPDKDPSLLDPKDRYAYQLKQAFPEKDAQYKVKGNFEDVALSMGLNPESAEAGFGSLISMDPVSSSAKTAIAIPKGLAELMPLIGGIIGGERAFKGTKFAKLFKTKMDTAKQMEKAGASKEEIAAVTELVELPDGRMVMWADHETTDAFKKKVPGIVGTSREGKATIETWNTTLGDAIAGDDDDIRQVLKNMDLENFPLEINPGLSGGISGGAYFDTKGNTPLKIALKYRNPELALHELSKIKSQQMQFLDAHNAELSQLNKSDPTYKELKDRIAYRQKYVDSLDTMIEQAERREGVDMPLPQVDYLSDTDPKTSAQASDSLLHETTHVGMARMSGPTGATMEDSYAVVGELFRLQNKNPADMTTEELEKLQHPAVQKLISGVGKTEIMDPDLGHYHLYKQSFGEGLARAAGLKYTDPTQNIAQLVSKELPYGGVTNQQVKAAADVLGVPFIGTD